MRDIKFRAYSKDLGMIYQGSDFGFEFGGGNNAIRIYSSDGEIDIIQYEEIKYMQYTGLKDRNGVEIYESDAMIMKSKKHGPHNVVVVYDAPEFRMQGNKSIFKDTKLSLGEIIGNIYENPELIE